MYTTNHTPIIDPSKSKTGCCTLIEPEQWDGQEFYFDRKLFVKETVRSIFHIPLNMSSVMTKTQATIHEAGAEPEEHLILSSEVSPWHSDQYFAVGKEVPGLTNVQLSGRYIAKVFEGDFKEAAKWHTSLADFVKSKGNVPLETLFFYTTCPNCAKAYGKNYVVGFARTA